MTDLHALIGRTLGGRYRIEALIGRGGFGAVYRAVHIELDRPVAIKTLVAREGIAAQMQSRFRREARVQAELRHPSIVHLLDFGREPDDTCYMVSEYVDGRTLKETVDAEGPLTPPRAARIVIDVLDGLAAAHRRGIVHRDIKPANIMLVDGPEGEEVRLLDFGIAKVRDAVDESQTLTAQGQLLGTPAFMAPEQIQQEPPSPATDLYAMGGVLYYLLSGQKPYSGGIRAVLTAHLMQPAPTLPPGIGAGFDAVVARAMAKVPAARYASAEAMRGAVAAVAAVGAGGTLSMSGVAATPWTSGALVMPPPAQVVAEPATDEMSATDTWVTPVSGVIEGEPRSTRSDIFVPPVVIAPTTKAAPTAPTTSRRWQPIAALALLAVGVALAGMLFPFGEAQDGIDAYDGTPLKIGTWAPDGIRVPVAPEVPSIPPSPPVSTTQESHDQIVVIDDARDAGVPNGSGRKQHFPPLNDGGSHPVAPSEGISPARAKPPVTPVEAPRPNPVKPHRPRATEPGC